jgi:hypothetical protein
MRLSRASSLARPLSLNPTSPVQDTNSVNRRAPMEGLFYHDEKGNPRKMSFSYDRTKEDKTIDEVHPSPARRPILTSLNHCSPSLPA